MKLIKFPLLTASWLLVIFIALGQPLHADRIDGLYSLDALVKDTRDSTRAEAARDLLKQLLVRVSGTRRVLEQFPPDGFADSPEDYEDNEAFSLWQQLSNAQRWVSQYSYESTSELIELESGEQTQAYRLQLEFDPESVKNLLQQMQAPVWGVSRPKTLFLIALEGRQGRYLVTPRTNRPLTNLLTELGEERGLPLMTPDEPASQLPEGLLSDIWGGFYPEVLQASQAYQPDAVAIGRIYPASGRWMVSWQLHTGVDRVSQRSQARTLGEALRSGVDFATESLSQRYASSPDQGAGRYRLALSNIREVEDFSRLLDYLNRLSVVDQVDLLKVSKDQLLIAVDLRGGMDQLKANLRLDGRLTETSFFSLQETGPSQDFSGRQGSNPSPGPGAQEDVVAEEEERPFFRQVDAWFQWQQD
ncbi:DUF2066 domain-containing protein [Marinospirillum perlucidum]|uniref:DUF2066 domain-containing protein n=1 Tax=Marinospirillum perlucidum TaxID=1982602 RepID=UPI00139040BB|nr:DUF2066 domain-containing protein [Marinospirillum perlucidum]